MARASIAGLTGTFIQVFKVEALQSSRGESVLQAGFQGCGETQESPSDSSFPLLSLAFNSFVLHPQLTQDNDFLLLSDENL